MARAVALIQADLDTINAALNALYSGKRITELRVGSADFVRSYRYQEITVESMLAHKTLLEVELLATTGNTPTFRQFSSYPIIVNKQGVY